MFAIERRNYIIKYLKENGSINVEDLAEILNVSPMTIRRDLKYLEENDLLVRTFGGAVLKDSLIEEVPYNKKSEINMDEKKRIAEYAVSIIKEGDTIILDAGTTNMEIAKYIKDMKSVTVITTDLMIAGYLANNNVHVFCTGGEIQNSTGSCVGINAAEFLQKINADIAFIGASSVDIKKGITTPNFQKARVKRQMIDSADKAVLVSDSSKFKKMSFVNVSTLKELDLIITDSGIDKKIVEYTKKQQILMKIV